MQATYAPPPVCPPSVALVDQQDRDRCPLCPSAEGGDESGQNLCREHQQLIAYRLFLFLARTTQSREIWRREQ